MNASGRTTRTIIWLLSGKSPWPFFSLLLVERLFSKTQYCHENLKSKSKEINESGSTLTQDIMSRTAFSSSRIFLLSFSFPGDCCMRFSDAPFVHIGFCFWLFGFLCFPIFSSPVCLDFSLMLTSFFFWKYTHLHHWAIHTKTMRKSLRWNSFWKVVRTSVIYLKMMLENFVWKKSTNLNL